MASALVAYLLALPVGWAIGLLLGDVIDETRGRMPGPIARNSVGMLATIFMWGSVTAILAIWDLGSERPWRRCIWVFHSGRPLTWTVLGRRQGSSRGEGGIGILIGVFASAGSLLGLAFGWLVVTAANEFPRWQGATLETSFGMRRFLLGSSVAFWVLGVLAWYQLVRRGQIVTAHSETCVAERGSDDPSIEPDSCST